MASDKKDRKSTKRRSAEEEKEPVHKPESSTTLPGGVYKDAEGDGFHNAHGQPVDQEGNILEVDADEDEGEGNEDGSQS